MERGDYNELYRPDLCRSKSPCRRHSTVAVSHYVSRGIEAAQTVALEWQILVHKLSQVTTEVEKHLGAARRKASRESSQLVGSAVMGDARI